MGFAVTLALDEAAAAEVRGLWFALADLGIMSMAAPGADPHVSLVLWDSIDRSAIERGLAAVAAETGPLDIVLAGVATFGTSVAYLELAPAPALRELHARLHERWARLGTGPSPHYAPGAWVPHCTLAEDLGPATARLALQTAAARVPLRARLESIALVEFPPVQRLFSARLTGQPAAGS